MTAAEPRVESLRATVMRTVNRSPSLAYGLYHLLAPYAQLLGLIALLAVAPPTWPWRAAIFAAVGWTHYRFYFPLHDACHLVLLPGDRANVVAGHLLSATMLTSFDTFTALHMVHHRWYGTAEDPGGIDYYLRFRTGRSLVVFLLWPLVGLSVVEKLWTNLVRPVWDRMAGGAGAGDQRPAAQRHSAPTVADAIWLVAVQAVIAALFTWASGGPAAYVIYFVLPEATIFLFLARLRMYLEHGSVDYAISDYLGPNPRRIARTHKPHPLERPLLSYMNFHYHWEHHLVPSLPSVRLPDVHRLVGPEARHPDDRGTTYTATLLRLTRLASTGDAVVNPPVSA